jgi:uncharacterized protein (TIGR00725 family)
VLISVIGSGDCSPAVASVAEAVGRGLAEGGATLVCGGRGGVMEAACRGARAAGGHTVGILPGFDTAEANPYVEFPIPTGLGHARNSIVALAGQAIIAIDGSYGTLSEIAFALIYGTPVIGLDTWEFSEPGRPAAASPGPPGIIRASDPADAVQRALAAARARTPAPQPSAVTVDGATVRFYDRKEPL